MGEKTGISWCDHTFNPWIGCTKVSPGCDHCYAERENDRRFHWVPGWGKGQERRRTSESNWLQPVYWGRAAVAAGKRKRVFCASLADVFDGEIEQEWREDLWALMERTLNVNGSKDSSGLEWMLLTKRPTNIHRMLPAKWIQTPPAWLRIGVSVEDQAHDGRILKLLEQWSGPNFISVEPMLGRVDINQAIFGNERDKDDIWAPQFSWVNGKGIDWVICGCESGPEARPMEIEWVRDLLDQCLAAGVAFFIKQSFENWKLVKNPFLDGRQWMEFPDAK